MASAGMDRNSVLIAFDILVATITGAIAVALVVPLSAGAVVAFAGAVIFTRRARLRDGKSGLAATGAIAASFVFLAIVAAAAMYQPIKTAEQQLNRVVSLPSTQMSLAELADHMTNDRLDLPFRTSICFANADKDIVVEWRARQLTLREFLDAIETQTVLRHDFRHCGNGYTVLFGGDCSFGLHIGDPDLEVRPLPREPFDVRRYALRQDAI